MTSKIWNDKTIKILKDGWGKIGRLVLAKEIGTNERGIASMAQQLGLPNITQVPNNPDNPPPAPWTAEEKNIIRNNITLSYADLCALLPGRSKGAIIHQYQYLARNGDAPRRKPKSGPERAVITDWNENYTEPAYVTMADAISWMQQARRGWAPSGDDAADLREINKERKFGQYPVNPFAIIKAGPGWQAPRWDVGNNAASEYAK